MNKKVMAVAVAAALAAPAAALAQVTISGKFNAEYGFASQMDTTSNFSRDSTDGFNSGASNIRLAGEEKLGGGNSVWFQCETRARWGVDLSPTQGTSGICDRNSALGFKGAFGNFFVGRWDTAVEDSSGLTRLTGSTGWDGRQHLLTESQDTSNTATNIGISFAQRVQNSFNYNSPNFSGFQVNLSTTSAGSALNTGNVATQSGLKGRIYSILAKYEGGPLLGYLGYETHSDNQAVTSGGRDGAKENFLTFGISYVYGPVKFAAIYTDVDADGIVAGTDVTRSTWQIGADWKVTPAGTVRFVYTQADDYEGTDARAALADQGAKQYSIGYFHALSKRTTVGVYYTAVDNDTNGVYNFASFNTANKLGDNASAFVFQAVHNF